MRSAGEPDTRRMAEMTKDRARSQPEGVAEGSGTLGEAGMQDDAPVGMSSNSGVTDQQPLDAQMAQQAHQPQQGSEGGFAPDGVGSAGGDEEE